MRYVPTATQKNRLSLESILGTSRQNQELFEHFRGEETLTNLGRHVKNALIAVGGHPTGLFDQVRERSTFTDEPKLAGREPFIRRIPEQSALNFRRRLRQEKNAHKNSATNHSSMNIRNHASNIPCKVWLRLAFGPPDKFLLQGSVLKRTQPMDSNLLLLVRPRIQNFPS